MRQAPVRIAAASLILIAATFVPSGCTGAPPANPTAFSVEYETGSIPPPFNHAYELSGTFEDSSLSVVYELTYRFREGMSEEELAERGYSMDDDLSWRGRLTGEAAEAWRTLVRDARLSPPAEARPGSDSFIVTIRYDGAPAVNGVPEAREEWEQRIDSIDEQARSETGHPRSER